MPEKLSKIYKDFSNTHWKYNCKEGIFNSSLVDLYKTKKYWGQIYVLIHKILKKYIKLKPEVFH